MILTWITFGLSVLILIGLLLAFFALVARARLAIDHPSKLGFKWFPDIFKQALALIRRCLWILIIPLTAEAIVFVQSLAYEEVSLINIVEGAREFPLRFLEMFDPLSFFGFLVFLQFFSSLFQLYSAMISPFSSGLIAGICLLGATVVFLIPKMSGAVSSLSNIKQGRRRFLGVIAGVAGLFLLSDFVLSFFMKMPDMEYSFNFFWLKGRLLLLMALPVGAFAGSMLLVLAEAANEGENLTITEGMSRAVEHFRPLLYFGLVIFGIGLIVSLPLTVDYFFMQGSEPGNPRTIYSLWEAVLMPAASILIAMTSFVPAIIVIRRVSFVSAINHCIRMWARYPWAALKLVVFGGLLLTVAGILQHMFRFTSKSNVIIIAPDIFSFLKIAIGVFIVSSMVVFYKTLRESEEGVT
jgi:hypothetical protein